MENKLLVPDIGDFEKVEIIEILVKKGDKIKKNDPIVTLESDKSSVEVPSISEGIVENRNNIATNRTNIATNRNGIVNVANVMDQTNSP